MAIFSVAEEEGGGLVVGVALGGVDATFGAGA